MPGGGGRRLEPAAEGRYTRAMHRATVALLALAALPFSACTPGVVVPDQDRLRLTRELEGQRLWLRVAVFLGPFFSDREKALATDQPLSEVELIEGPGGETILPPPAERVLPPGTSVVVRDVEFPTPWVIARRVLLTPRTHPWVWLEVPGESRPVILVVSRTAATYEDVRAEIDRYLSSSDPGRALAALSDFQRKAIEKKEVVEGMGHAAVAMAWGHPEKRILDRPSGKEQWLWPGGRRKAWFEDDRLIRFEGR